MNNEKNISTNVKIMAKFFHFLGLTALQVKGI